MHFPKKSLDSPLLCVLERAWASVGTKVHHWAGKIVDRVSLMRLHPSLSNFDIQE